MVYKPLGADLAGYVIVPDQAAMQWIQSPTLTEIGRQLYVRPICSSCKLTRCIRMAGLDTDRVAVGLVGAPADLFLWD